MLLIISKILALLFYPVGLAAIALAIAVAALYIKRRKTALVSVIASAAVLWAFSSPIVAHVLVRTLESKYDPPADFPKVSAIVALGGCTQPAVLPRRYVETNCNADRIFHAARLFRAGYAPYLICTGGRIPFIYNFEGSEAACMASIFKEFWGIDTPALILEDKAQSTRDHAPNVEKILTAKGLPKEVIVVTTASHMYRSVRIFRKKGYSVYPAPTDYWEDKKVQLNLMAFLPSAVSLFESTIAMHEYYGILAYKIRGWI
jgi:uncharacterized SAM-binding protein YcdF (DUF218 family)